MSDVQPSSEQLQSYRTRVMPTVGNSKPLTAHIKPLPGKSESAFLAATCGALRVVPSAYGES